MEYRQPRASYSDSLVLLVVMCVFTLCLPSPTRADDCPARTGEEEYKQMRKYWLNEIKEEDTDMPVTLLARRLALVNLYNPKVLGYIKKPFQVTVQSNKLKRRERGYTVRLVLTEEDGHQQRSSGGSSFSGRMMSRHTRMPCATRDYFNGTYLMCCDLIEDGSTLTITHEYQQFTAFEVYEKHVMEDVYTETFTLSSTDDMEILRPDQTSCYDVDMAQPDGFWMWDANTREWVWVVDGCVMREQVSERTLACIQEQYGDAVTAMGDSHLRNLFYYVMTFIDPNYFNLDKVHKNMEWKKHYYIWSTSCMTITEDLMKLADKIEDTNSKSGTKSNNKHILFMDMGVWQLISRPAFDYITCMSIVLPVLQRLQGLNVKIIWQTMPSAPTAEFEEPNVWTQRIGQKRSNHVVGALNFIVCNLLDTLDIPCVPNWLFTYSWRDDLVCGALSHTMCARPGGMLDVTAPGKASTQYALHLACPLSEEEFVEQYKDRPDDMPHVYLHPQKLFNLNEHVNDVL